MAFERDRVMNTRIVLLALAVGSQVACSSSPDEPKSRAALGSGADSNALAGYQHTFNKSRFAIGDSTNSLTEFGIYKVVGPWGVFGTHANTGKVLASPNGDSPSLNGARILDEVVHNNTVKSYFTGAGLPAEQILEVKAMPVIVSAGAAADYAEDESPTPQLDYYFSHISRQWQGIPIRESEAWARMNETGEVVSESVYWPEIPSGTLAAAAAFAKHLEDPAWKASFVAKLPQPDGVLVIHHTPAVWPKSFASTVSYDVPMGNRDMHFNEQGVAFNLPDEDAKAWEM
jgi:hypothetical protein